MSDNRLVFVPIDPNWCPSQDDAARALELFKTMAPYNVEITTDFHDQTEFHFGMRNWSGVSCPTCGTDIEKWFFDAANAAFAAGHFADLNAITGCCKSSVSLNDLVFEWPAGFSRFSLAAMNPGFLPTAAHIETIEQALGTKCRVIWERI